MCKKNLFIILFTIILLSLIPFIKKGEKQDDTINYLINENIVDNTSFENNIKENLNSEENVIQQDIINENKLENDVINDIKEEKKTKNNTSFSEEITTNNNKTDNKNINNNSKKEEIKTQEKKEEIVEEEYKQDDKVEEKTEQKVEQNTKEEIKESTIAQETKYEYVYNYDETQRLKKDIEEIAKDNLDLFDKSGNKLYRIDEFSSEEQAMNKTNYFSPYNILEVKGVVLNTYSCTFLVHAIDYKINGILQHTRYYIKVTEF